MADLLANRGRDLLGDIQMPITRKEDIPKPPTSPFSSALQPNYEGVIGAQKALETPIISKEQILSTPGGQMASGAVSAVGGSMGPFMGALIPPQYKEQRGAEELASFTSPANIATMFIPMKRAVAQETIPMRGDMAGGIINSLIKPKDVEFRYHNNPGKVVAQEGLWAPTAKALRGVIEKRIGEVHGVIDKVRSGLDHTDKKIDITDMQKPLAELFTRFGEKPETNEASINKLKKNETDLKNFLSKENFDIQNVTPEQAYKIKDFVDDFIDWNKTEKSDVEINKAFKDIYHNIDKKLDNAIPDLAQYNERIRGLYDARKALNRRLLVEQRRGMVDLRIPEGFAGLLGFGVGHTPGAIAGIMASEVARSTAFKTGLARLLAERYPAIGK